MSVCDHFKDTTGVAAEAAADAKVPLRGAMEGRLKAGAAGSPVQDGSEQYAKNCSIFYHINSTIIQGNEKRGKMTYALLHLTDSCVLV